MPEHEGITEFLILILIRGGRVMDNRVGVIVRGPGHTIVKTVGNRLGLLVFLNGLSTWQSLCDWVLSK
jgi:hypothetical protein